jgi:hypothetical protein
MVRQGFLYEDADDPVVVGDISIVFFKDFIKAFLIKYKEDYENKFGKVKDPKLSSIQNLKIKVDKILDTFIKRITYKKRSIISTQIKYINNNFSENDLPDSFNNLLKHVSFLNKNLVGKFTKNITTKKDMDKALLMTEEFGFNVENAFDWGVKIGEWISRQFDKIFNIDDDEIESELSKGYFTEIYDKYSKIKKPKVNELNNLKSEFINQIKVACDEIEGVFHKNINITKNKINLDKIIKYLKINENK